MIRMVAFVLRAGLVGRDGLSEPSGECVESDGPMKNAPSSHRLENSHPILADRPEDRSLPLAIFRPVRRIGMFSESARPAFRVPEKT